MQRGFPFDLNSNALDLFTCLVHGMQAAQAAGSGTERWVEPQSRKRTSAAAQRFSPPAWGHKGSSKIALCHDSQCFACASPELKARPAVVNTIDPFDRIDGFVSMCVVVVVRCTDGGELIECPVMLLSYGTSRA